MKPLTDTYGGLSIVIPCRGRAGLLRRLLESILADAEGWEVDVEILLVDDTQGGEGRTIQEIASRHGARLLTGVAHVGEKRNWGMREARYDLVLFLDSDVVIRPGTLQAHWDALRAPGDPRLAGCLGSVFFVGEPTFAWQVISEMQLTLPFTYPLVSDVVPWGPTANISFRRAAFLEVGGFDTTLPHFGGEDVDLGLRLTRAGYRIATSRKAVAEHAIETWNSWGQNLRRLFHYGQADFHLLIRHSDRSFLDFPSAPILWLLQLSFVAGAGVTKGISAALWLLVAFASSVVAYHVVYAVAKKRTGSRFLVHLPGPFIFYWMDVAKVVEAIRHGRPDLIVRRIKFLDDLIAQDWPEIAASAWGVTAASLVFAVAVVATLRNTF